jgi:hypothetical protein
VFAVLCNVDHENQVYFGQYLGPNVYNGMEFQWLRPIYPNEWMSPTNDPRGELLLEKTMYMPVNPVLGCFSFYFHFSPVQGGPESVILQLYPHIINDGGGRSPVHYEQL